MFGAVWDLDGTLVDTEMLHYGAWRVLMREHGRDLTHAQFLPTFGLRNDDTLRDHFGFSDDDAGIARMSERKEVLFRTVLEREGIQMMSGARELVEHLFGFGWPQAIASSAPPENIAALRRLISFPFDTVVSSQEVLRGKPAPDIVLRAAERLDVPPSHLAVLEDAPAGVAAGKAAGCHVIAIEGSFPAARLAEADLVVQSFDEVLWPRERWEAFITSEC
ncbi:MAG: HAD family hydrolase [Chloroflexota bacterium]|nr:MAG: beta-phosphoglucomutase [Chloroflexota bacterium]